MKTERLQFAVEPKYLRCGKKVTLAGVAFDAEMRNLSDRQIEVADM